MLAGSMNVFVTISPFSPSTIGRDCEEIIRSGLSVFEMGRRTVTIDRWRKLSLGTNRPVRLSIMLKLPCRGRIYCE